MLVYALDLQGISSGRMIMPLKVVLGGTIAYDLDGRLNRPEIPIVRDGRHGGKFYSLLTATLVSLEPQ